jgi:hypothetical protein
VLTAAQAAAEIPAVEWWDAPLLADRTYASILSGGDLFADTDVPPATAVERVEIQLNQKKITNLVEHPVPVQPPVATAEAPMQAVMLTKKVGGPCCCCWGAGLSAVCRRRRSCGGRRAWRSCATSRTRSRWACARRRPPRARSPHSLFTCRVPL